MNEPVAHAVKLLINPCLFSTWNSNAVIRYFNRQIGAARFGCNRNLLHLA
jgi:hypothetical protein